MTLVVIAAAFGLLIGWFTTRIITAESAEPIPAIVPALATALLCAATAWRFGSTWALPVYVYFAVVSVPLAVIDLRTHRLPNRLTMTAYPVVLIGLAIPAVAGGSWPPFWRALLAGAGLLAFFLLLHVINPGGMGLGDVKLAGPMGALLGWIAWPTLIAGTFICFVLAAVLGLTLMALGKAGRKSALPFGPFMLAGAWVAILAT